MHIDKALFFALATGIAAMAQACDSHPADEHAGGHDSDFPACAAIIAACHPKDVGDLNDVNACHSLAHDAKGNDDCVPREQDCVQLCNDFVVGGADAGGGDAGGGDADGGDGG